MKLTKKYNPVTNVFIFLMFSYFLALPASSYALKCAVTKVIDGDTFYCKVEDYSEKKYIYKGETISVRMYGIDAPETNQPFGKESKLSLESLIYGRTVDLDVKNIDIYNRIIAHVWLDGNDINLEQVRRGYAWAYTEYLDSPYKSEFYEIESQARKNRAGLWGQNNPTSPWEWRAENKDHDSIKHYKTKQNVYTDEELRKYKSDRHTEKYKDTDNTPNCGKKRFCFQMHSCEEAMFYYKTCGLSRLDGDNDGVPCENLCRK